MGFLLLYYNGQFVERSTVHIDIEDRGYQFGDGIYEVIRVYHGKPFYLKEHLTRFFRSAKELHISLPFTKEEIHHSLLQLVQKNGLDHGNIYIQATRGVAPRNHAFPSDTKAITLAYTISSARPLEALQQGVQVITAEDIRWLRCDIKSLNLLGAVLAKQKAVDANCFEAILIRDQVVTEGSSTNVFFVKEEKLYTHPANQHILHGITREIVLELARQLNIPVVFQALPEDDLAEVEECFLTGTTTEVCPVVEIDGKPVGSGKPGPITRKLQQAFEKEIGRLALVT